VVLLLDEDEGVHGLAFVPGFVEHLGADNPLGRHDLAIDTAHSIPSAACGFALGYGAANAKPQAANRLILSLILT
jgi:hypothetical protein